MSCYLSLCICARNSNLPDRSGIPFLETERRSIFRSLVPHPTPMLTSSSGSHKSPVSLMANIRNVFGSLFHLTTSFCPCPNTNANTCKRAHQPQNLLEPCLSNSKKTWPRVRESGQGWIFTPAWFLDLILRYALSISNSFSYVVADSSP